MAQQAAAVQPARAVVVTPAAWAGTSAAIALGVGVAAFVRRAPIRLRWWPLWLVGVAAVSFVLNATIARQRGLPEPRVHDEFSYLLAADTFAHGRLANPTPPAWPALQSFHVLVRPTYASKYPPGQGLVLALGQVMTGLPIVGAWLATSALAAAVGWAAAGLLPPPWAVGAAVLTSLHPQVIEWSQTYWGGSVAAVGGALVLGGWARRARGWNGIAFGVGLGVLLLTRPYEGAAFAVPFVGHVLMRRPRSLAWAAVGFAPLLVFAGVYNAAVTGRPWRLPYLAYERQYAAAPPLVVQSPRPVPAGVPASMRAYAEQVELPHHAAQRTVRGFVTTAIDKVRFLLAAAVPSPWLWPLAVLVPWAVVAERHLRVVAFALVATLMATLLSNWTRTQYVAPATVAVAVLLTAACRTPFSDGPEGRASLPDPARPSGPSQRIAAESSSPFAPVEAGSEGTPEDPDRTVGDPGLRAYPQTPASQAVIPAAILNGGQRSTRALWAAAVVGTAVLSFAPPPPGPRFQRDQLVAQLDQKPGRHLVLVRYGPDHRPDDEWVYNDADPSGARIVWARDDDATGVAAEQVRTAYPGRTVWHLLVTADAAIPSR